MSKLYYVELKGMKSSYGSSYVVADNPDEALRKVQKYVNENNLGFTKDREMDCIKLLADTEDYSNCGVKLYL
jgi:hypothetical protein